MQWNVLYHHCLIRPLFALETSAETKFIRNSREENGRIRQWWYKTHFSCFSLQFSAISPSDVLYDHVSYHHFPLLRNPIETRSVRDKRRHQTKKKDSWGSMRGGVRNIYTRERESEKTKTNCVVFTKYAHFGFTERTSQSRKEGREKLEKIASMCMKRRANRTTPPALD